VTTTEEPRSDEGLLSTIAVGIRDVVIILAAFALLGVLGRAALRRG
jgi:hypothetical protein